VHGGAWARRERVSSASSPGSPTRVVASRERIKRFGRPVVRSSMMAALARSAGLAAAMGIALGLTADCASLDVLTSGQGDAGMEGASPDGAREGGTRDAPALQDGGDATAVDAPGTCPIVYVSTTGSDSSTGCNPTKPKKTISAAVQYATSLGGGRAIHVCKGTYAETALTLNAALSLGGGYDCATWKRTSTFGYPKFDGVNETIIQNADDATSPVTLLVSGPVITSAQVVDGLTIEGSATGTVESAALVISGAATPLVTNNKVEGGATSDPTLIGSLGLEVETGAAPDITGNSIAGGEGSTPSEGMGSLGLLVTDSAGAPHIHANSISGGSGTCGNATNGSGSVAVWLDGTNTYTAATGNAFEDNIINGGSGTFTIGTLNQAAASCGMVVTSAGPTIDILNNTIDGGTGSTVTGAEDRALTILTPGKVRLIGNRIYGGSESSLAVLVESPGASVINNMIYAGNDSASPSIITVYGLAVGADDVSVLFNTIFSGYAKSDANTVWVVGSSGDIFQNNLFVGSGAVSTGFFLDDCQATTGALAVVENNAFLNLGFGPLTYVSGLTGGGNCTSNRHLTTISSFEAEVATHSGSSASGNVLLAGSCEDAGTGCIATTANTAATLFAAWSAADNGYSTLFGAGWMLKAGDPCAVTKSSLDLLATVSTDLYGTARTSTPSMGAAQFGGSCK
jgi:hypothetical protein